MSEGVVLFWLGGDTRSMRYDTWFEIPPLPESSAENFEICHSVPACEERPAETDTKEICSLMSDTGCQSPKLLVFEVTGLRLFQHKLREFGVLDDEQENEKLAGYFNHSAIG